MVLLATSHEGRRCGRTCTLLDAEMFQRQESAIADSVVREGRSLVVAANKMELLVDGEYSKEEYAQGVRQIEMRFPMLRETPVAPMCSLCGKAVDDLDKCQQSIS